MQKTVTPYLDLLSEFKEIIPGMAQGITIFTVSVIALVFLSRLAVIHVLR